MKEFSIRPARLADLDVLRHFQQGVVAAERPFDPTLRPGTLHYYDIEALLSDPTTLLVVAELGPQVIGSGYARVQPAKPYLRHEQYAYLGFMYVRPEYRNQGVNKQILGVLTQWAVAQGLTEMRLEVYAENTAALRAYEKAGFAGHMLEMRMGI